MEVTMKRIPVILMFTDQLPNVTIDY